MGLDLVKYIEIRYHVPVITQMKFTKTLMNINIAIYLSFGSIQFLNNSGRSITRRRQHFWKTLILLMLFDLFTRSLFQRLFQGLLFRSDALVYFFRKRNAIRQWFIWLVVIIWSTRLVCITWIVIDPHQCRFHSSEYVVISIGSGLSSLESSGYAIY